MTPLTRLRLYEMNRLLQRAGWPVAGGTDTPTAPALAAAVLGVSVTTLRRLEAEPWAVSGRALWLILRAVNRLGVPWTPNDYFGIAGACEAIPVGPPDPASVYENDDPSALYPETAPVGVPRFEPLGSSVRTIPDDLIVSETVESVLTDPENNLTQDLTTYPRQE